MQVSRHALRPSTSGWPAIRAVALAAVVTLVAGACRPNDSPEQEPPLQSNSPVDRVSYEDSSATGVNLVPATEMRAAMRARYRLRPDRRFLLAVADVHHALTGEPLSVVHARRREGKWVIVYKSQDVGTMSDVPSYQSSQTLIDTWVTRVAKGRVNTTPQAPDSSAAVLNRFIDEYTPERLFEALRLIDGRWSDQKTRDPAILALAARALVGLVMQGVDRAGAADLLAARAFAYVSLARVLSGDRVTDADALLAWLCGYRDASSSLASTLSPNHAVRLLVTGDLDALARAAIDSGSPRIMRLAQLRALAAAGRREPWLNAVAAQHVDLARDPEAAATGLLLGDFALSAGLPRSIEKAVVARVDPAAARVALRIRSRVRLASYQPAAPPEDDGEPSPAATLPRLDARAKGLGATLAGPALDPDVFASFYRGLLHSAYLSYGLFHLELRSDYPSAVEFGRRFDGLDSTTADGQFGAWYTRLATAYATGADRMSLIDDLTRFRSLSGEVLSRTFDAMSDRVRPSDPRRARMVRLLSERLDTRPSHRARYAAVARNDLLDPVIVAQLYGSSGAALAQGNADMALWLATAYQDAASTLAIVTDTSAPTRARTAALGWLAEYSGLPVDQQKQQLERIIAHDPADWDARGHYILLLRATHDYAAAEREARDYIRLGRADNWFDLVWAQVSIGKTLLAQNRFREAFDAMRPAIATEQAGAMNAGVNVLIQAGRLTEAAALADRIVKRYPDSGIGRAARLEVWWRQGNHAAAAKELRENEWLSREDHIANAFIEAFGSAGDRVAARAALALAQEGVSGDILYGIGVALHRAGRDDLAFELASRGSDPNPMATVFQMISASRFLASARGHDASVEWLRQRLPMPLGDDLAMFFWDVGHDEMLWSWQPNDGRDEGRFTWLMRSVAAVRSGLDKNAHRQELLDHYATSNDSPYYVMGRYLVGLEREDAMLALATTLHRKCEVSFYLGVRARAEGRIADAVDWFRVAVETAQGDGEYFWALRALAEISNDPRGLTIPSAVPGVQ